MIHPMWFVKLSCYSSQFIIAMLINDEFVGLFIHMYVFHKHSDLVFVSKDHCEFFKWYAFCFWDGKICPDNANCANDNENLSCKLRDYVSIGITYQVELPTDISKRLGRSLEVDKIGDSN